MNRGEEKCATARALLGTWFESHTCEQRGGGDNKRGQKCVAAKRSWGQGALASVSASVFFVLAPSLAPFSHLHKQPIPHSKLLDMHSNLLVLKMLFLP